MSQRDNRKASKKFVTPDSKHSKTSSDRSSGYSSSSSFESVTKKYKGAEVSNNAKVQPWSQRSHDGAGCAKTKRKLDLKDFEKQTSEETSSSSSVFLPTEKREKITLQFKNKAKVEGDGRSSKNTIAAFPCSGGSGSNTSNESDIQRRKKEDLKILNSWEKNRKKARMELTKLKEVIVKRVLEQSEGTVLPTLCSSLHKKKPSNLSTVSRPQKPSKKLYPAFDDSSGRKLYIPECKEELLKTAKHASQDKMKLVPLTKSDKMKLVPLTKLSKEQREQQCLEPVENICSTRACRKNMANKVLHTNQNTRSQHHSCLAETSETTDVDEEMQIVEDLHAARVDKKIALPVVETCGELTSMEIDLPDVEANTSSRNLSDMNTLIVIDTNILISHLKLIKSLKNTDIPGIGKFGLVIPWVVLQELDNLKKGRILANVSQKAIPAVQFIHTCLKDQDSKLWGQSLQLASQQPYGFRVENNDDRVLQCCLQYQKLFPQAEVVLLTDDKNLCNKALVSEVKALGKTELVTALQKLSVNSAPGSTSLQSGKDAGPKNFMEKCTDPSSSMICDLEKTLGEVLSSILQTEMKIAYGDLWTEVVYRKPPWTLADLLECYKKHWIAVFGQIISRSYISTVEYLSTHLATQSPGKTSAATTKQVLWETKMLLEVFSSRSDYDGALPQALVSVNKLCETLEKMGTEQNSSVATCGKVEDMTLTQDPGASTESLQTKQLAQGNRHQEIWSVLEGIWNTMNLYRLEVFQKLDLSAIDIAHFKEAFLGLQKLMEAVNEILAGIRQILMPNSSFQDVWTLYNFLTKNKINISIAFTAEEFYDCVSQETYRERLSIGCSQLVQLEDAVKQFYESVGLEAKNRGWL